jgi:hypothetical protein
VLFAAAAFTIAEVHAGTYRGRVEYAATGKPAGNVIVEARSHSGRNLLFWIPRVPYVTLRSATTRSDGTFSLELPPRVERLRLAARGNFYVGGSQRWDVEISPRADTLTVIKLPETFRPSPPRKPLYPPNRSNQAMQLTASKLAIYAAGVCHRASGLRANRPGLAAADLVSR